MHTTTAFGKILNMLGIIACFQIFLLQSCKKEFGSPITEQMAGRKKPLPHQPPQPSPQFYFSNCGYPTINGSFVKGEPANAAITMNYINSPGGAYPAFTSSTVNGITLTAPAGVLNTGSGSITYTASGTPLNSGYYSMTVSIGTSVPCSFVIAVLNPVPSGTNCSDPDLAVGSTGCINFNYRGQQVTYTTVRAADGKIWLQQNLGSPQVAMHSTDQASFGDYFQWGRWDDGHQVRNSPTITGGSTLLNPSNISPGNLNFIIGTTAGTSWWGVGGLSSDTWSGTTATVTNGKDPCALLGAGWRLPSATDWQNVAIYEDLFGTLAAYQSNLKLPSSGYRYSEGGWLYPNTDIGYYWTSTAADNSLAKVFFFDESYNAGVTISKRGEGYPCRCIKD